MAKNNNAATTNDTEAAPSEDFLKAQAIVRAGVEAELNDDLIMIELLKAGVGMKKSAKYFVQAMQSLGLRISAADRKEMADKIIKPLIKKVKDYEDLEGVVAAVVEGVGGGTTEKQALGLIRKFAKDAEIALPKKPAGAKVGVGGFQKEVFEQIRKAPTMSNAEFEEWFRGVAKMKNVDKALNKQRQILTLVRNVVADFSEPS